jgi:hypothetical protein
MLVFKHLFYYPILQQVKVVGHRAIFQQIKEAALGNINSINENGLYHVSILAEIIFLG